MNEKKLNKSRSDIAAFVSEKRRELNVTQDQLAEITGMGIATIKRFESGRFWISTKHLVLICDALNIRNVWE